jgi:GNAT superfamily N-acetyltransferase
MLPMVRDGRRPRSKSSQRCIASGIIPPESRTPVSIRPAAESDRLPLAVLFAAVAEEGGRIGAEPPVDLERRAASWDLGSTLVASADGNAVGLLFIIQSGFGFGEIGMMVAADSRGRGVGTALVDAAIAF